MKNLIKNTKIYLLLYLAFLAGAGAILLAFGKSQVHLYINSLHTPAADFFFKHITNLGDGLVPVIVSLFLLFFSFRKAIIVALSTGLAGAVVQLLKIFVYPEIARPKAYFGTSHELYLVPGVEVHSAFSFPSGHTATAFCLFFVFSFFLRRPALQVSCFLLAFMVGYSRMYLSQHFLTDVYVGSLTGILFAIAVLYMINASKKTWLDKNLVTSFKK